MNYRHNYINPKPVQEVAVFDPKKLVKNAKIIYDALHNKMIIRLE